MARTLETDVFQGPISPAPVARLFADGSDTQTGADIELTEATFRIGVWTGTIPVGAAAGKYRVLVFSGADLLSRQWVDIEAADGVYKGHDEYLASGIADVAAAAVWAYAQRTLTQSAVSVAAIIQGSVITLLRGDTIEFTITGLGNLAGRSKLWISGKSDVYQSDDEAIFRIEETNGLQRLMGAIPGTGQTAMLTVTDEVAGDITVTLSAAASAALATLSEGVYDVQVLVGGTIQTLTTSVLNVTGDVTRAVS